jgi:hypothetical protein
VLLKHLAALIAILAWLSLPGTTFAWFWSNPDWTMAKLDNYQKKMEKAANAKALGRAIRYGEQALEGCRELRGDKDELCITLATKNATYYYQKDLHPRHAEEIEAAYRLALAEQGPDHHNTNSLRDIYYHVLLRQKHFQQAIPVLRKMLQVEGERANEPSQTMRLTLQLYGLYYLTEQVAEAEAVLETLLPLVAQALGKQEDYNAVAVALAEAYCARKNHHQFFTFVREHGLDMRCEAKNNN